MFSYSGNKQYLKIKIRTEPRRILRIKERKKKKKRDHYAFFEKFDIFKEKVRISSDVFPFSNCLIFFTVLPSVYPQQLSKPSIN